MDKNEVNLEDTKGFNVLNDLSLFAHSTNQDTEEKIEKYTRALQEYTINHEQVIALPEEDTIFINDNEIQVIGIIIDLELVLDLLFKYQKKDVL